MTLGGPWSGWCFLSPKLEAWILSPMSVSEETVSSWEHPVSLSDSLISGLAGGAGLC
jgi:hypothetical protein